MHFKPARSWLAARNSILLLCLAAGAQAAGSVPAHRKPLDIQVQAGAFGFAGVADITAVLQSAGGELWRYCPDLHLDGIDVFRRRDHPQTALKRTPRGRIAVGLSAHDTYWAQYSFQFAHEFCHVLANYGENQQTVRPPPQANFWLEESLCETASLFTLAAMERSWRTDPPYPVWQSYAPWFRAYVDKRIAAAGFHLPPGLPFPVWFRANEPALRRNPAMWGGDTIVALQLLPLFQADPRGWEAVAYLNRGSPRDNQSLVDHLRQWRSQAPAELRPFIARLAAVFAVRL